MRHRKKSEKFSRSRAQRKALLRSLLRSIVIYERIVTTESKAKGLRRWADKLITWGKQGDLHSRRLAYSLLGDHKLVKKLFEDIAPRFRDVKGGYTRVIDMGVRKGDGATLSLFEFTRKGEKKVEAKKEEKKKERLPEEKVEKEKRKPVKEVEKEGFVSKIRKFFQKRERR